MEKKKGIKIRFTVAIIIIELVFLISMITVYYIYHLADNKKRTNNNSIIVENVEKQKENIKIERDITKDIERTSKYEWEEYPNDDKCNVICENQSDNNRPVFLLPLNIPISQMIIVIRKVLNLDDNVVISRNGEKINENNNATLKEFLGVIAILLH